MKDGHKEILKVCISVILSCVLFLAVDLAFPYRPWALWGT